MAMVDLEPVPEEAAIAESEYNAQLETSGRIDIDDLSSGDAERLRKLIENHARYTGSRRAAAILADWDRYRQMFRKVMPVEYRRALAELAKEAAAMQAAE
jgi:glutamate synthase (NADPH/NADH) large chain